MYINVVFVSDVFSPLELLFLSLLSLSMLHLIRIESNEFCFGFCVLFLAYNQRAPAGLNIWLMTFSKIISLVESSNINQNRQIKTNMKTERRKRERNENEIEVVYSFILDFLSRPFFSISHQNILFCNSNSIWLSALLSIENIRRVYVNRCHYDAHSWIVFAKLMQMLARFRNNLFILLNAE